MTTGIIRNPFRAPGGLVAETPVRIESVRVEGRYRADLGDLDSLAASIKESGLLHAIVITPDGRLVAGQRRLEACRRLGYEHIDARVVDNLGDAVALLTAERDENTQRKAMTVSERVKLAAALEELEKPRAEQRRREAAIRGKKTQQGIDESGCVPQETHPGRAAEIAGRAVGMPPTTYYKARKVVDAASDPTLPELDQAVAREALADMDATGNVAGNFEKVTGARSPDTTKPQKTTIATATAQRRAFTAAGQSLSGICHGLAQIAEVHPDITSEEAAQWVDSLSESRLVINQLIKRLKERNSA